MAHGTVEFFGPSCPITVDSNWAFQDGGAVQTQQTRASEQRADGDELASALHGKRSTTSFVFIHKGTGSALVFPKVGLVSSGWHIDSFSVRWDRGQLQPKMTVNCHRHDSGTNHSEGSCRTYTPSLDDVAPVSFGCPAAFGDAFALDAEAVVDLRDATYTVTVNHIDEPNRSGGNLAGNNHDATETLVVNLTGAASADDYSSDWDETTSASNPTNSGATATTLNFEHHLAHDSQ